MALGLCSLEFGRMRGDLIVTYPIVEGLNVERMSP